MQDNFLLVLDLRILYTRKNEFLLHIVLSMHHVLKVQLLFLLGSCSWPMSKTRRVNMSKFWSHHILQPHTKSQKVILSTFKAMQQSFTHCHKTNPHYVPLISCITLHLRSSLIGFDFSANVGVKFVSGKQNSQFTHLHMFIFKV